MRYHASLLLLPGTLAFQLPFKVPFFNKQVIRANAIGEHLVVDTPRIAIIGAGAGGSSAAFWISKAKERFGLDVEVDVYEREAYVGGRSTVVYPYDNSSLPPLELGASIFVEANKNLWRASDEFNLTRNAFEEGGETGVWDGEKLILSIGDGWWDTVKVLWRYGIFSPRRTQSIVDGMVKQFLKFYTKETPKWDKISDLATSMGWSNFVHNSTANYFGGQGVSEAYIYEIVEAATRVNYGQNADRIHALEGAASLATSGARGIQGGNFQLFEQFLNHSGAKVFLGTTVTDITQKSKTSHHWTVESSRGSMAYSAVILAAPLRTTGINLPSKISTIVPEQPYVHLHVTLLTTTSPTANPAYFSLPTSATVPRMMLTTHNGARQGGKEPEFNSMSYHGQIREGEWGVKIFSKERISNEWLEDMFLGKVGWVYRKEWDAYPLLPPTTSFPPIKLDRGLYYVNAFEPFISTMETETISSRNVVDLLLSEEFNASICDSRTPTPESADDPIVHTATPNDKDFVIGWDC
ncbi:Prenylcysteine lyase-domain-containing protein [Collybia nuda]|uniref:Prenylcysteine lyase-domain-containing protein n=1 Tax=Collybia nuda TaxID=64659 RepID=A0A9P6CF70_9AGAR|nr:Prenylcysteine lyase-domain-containing protein [Collybia nuda]